MKRIALYIAIGLVSFVAGLIGLYLAMPYLQPDKVDAIRAELDSLYALRADSLLAFDLPEEVDLVWSDSLAADSLDGELTGPIAIALEEHPRFVALMDSVAQLSALMKAAEDDRGRLLARLEDSDGATPAQTAAAGAASPDLAELAATLSRLEENELKPILDRVDDTTIRQLYDLSTGRNRTKILRSMNPDRAARLVQRMVGRPAPPPTQPASVTTEPANDRADDATE
jgi:hypothetical protein